MDKDFCPHSDPTLPVVLTPEDVYLYLFGGSSQNWKSEQDLRQMSIAELVNYGLQSPKCHLGPEKRRVLAAQLADPNSWVRRAETMMNEKAARVDRIDWFELLTNPAKKRSSRPLYQPPPAPRGDPQVAGDRDVIVRCVRDATADGRLSEGEATRVLAEAGESLSWVDSVPDRTAVEEPIAPVPGGSPLGRRKLMITHFPVLGEMMAEQNDTMCSRLAATHPDLAAEVHRRIAECRSSPGPGGGPGR